MLYNHGREYQIKVIHADGTEALSEWFEVGSVAETISAFRKAHIGACWLRERSIAATARLLYPVEETAIAEYLLTDCSCSRTRPDRATAANATTAWPRGNPKIADVPRG